MPVKGSSAAFEAAMDKALAVLERRKVAAILLTLFPKPNCRSRLRWLRQN